MKRKMVEGTTRLHTLFTFTSFFIFFFIIKVTVSRFKVIAFTIILHTDTDRYIIIIVIIIISTECSVTTTCLLVYKALNRHSCNLLLP